MARVYPTDFNALLRELARVAGHIVANGGATVSQRTFITRTTNKLFSK